MGVVDGDVLFCGEKCIFATVKVPAGPRTGRLSGTIRKLGLESCERVLGDVHGALWRVSRPVASSAWTVRGTFPVPLSRGPMVLDARRSALRPQNCIDLHPETETEKLVTVLQKETVDGRAEEGTGI